MRSRSNPADMSAKEAEEEDKKSENGSVVSDFFTEDTRTMILRAETPQVIN
jgi:hypothetical protein